MIKLMKLEWQKNRLGQYVKYALLCFAAVYLVTVLMAVISVKEGEMMFEDYRMFSEFYQMLVRIVFQIFSSVLLVRLVIDEYQSNMIQTAFTWPVPRKKMIAAKMLLTGLFTFAGILTAVIVGEWLTYMIQNYLALYTGTARAGEVAAVIVPGLLAAVMVSGISLIPLYVGMKKKTAPPVIITAVLLSLLLNGTFSGSSTAVSLFELLFVPLLLCAIGIIIGYVSWHKINRVDI